MQPLQLGMFGMDEPRAYTEDEIRTMLLRHMRSLAKYWATTKLDRKFETKEAEMIDRCEGVVHSILTTLDGCSIVLPGFQIIPNPHPDDKQYHLDHGENYFPDEGDISGFLHESFYKC